jgi:C1A family cysteine protease
MNFNKLSKLYRQYPVVKDKADSRDLTLSNSQIVTNNIDRDTNKVDLREFCGPVKDQGSTSSCTAHAVTSLREFLYRKYFSSENDKTIPLNSFQLSPRYIYYKEREFENDLAQDGGAQMRTAAKMLNNVGTCLLSSDPFNINILDEKPTPNQILEALKYKSGAYHRITGGIQEMKDVLKSGYAMIGGIIVYESFEDDYTARTGTMLLPNPSKEKYLGGHAIGFYGFDDQAEHFICLNSWGTGWGDKGFFYMPYSFASNPNYLSDVWVNHLGKAWGTTQEVEKVIEKSSQEG